MMRPMARARDVDVLVVGGGPGGSTTATFLAKGGLSVALVERERFPRFRVGESLIPTCMAICERMGVLDKVLAHGFQTKYGATFHDQEMGESSTFGFRPGRQSALASREDPVAALGITDRFFVVVEHGRHRVGAG